MAAELLPQSNDEIEGETFSLKGPFPESNNKAERFDILAHKASVDPDTMYLHQAMKEPDRKEFLKAMQKEWDDQYKNKNFSIIHRSQVPEGATILPVVWQMKRKRDIKTRKIKKCKARMNIDGSKMKQGQHYDQTYAPVASWNSIRLLLAMVIRHGWHTKQLDYVLAFPQAPVERDMCMCTPSGFEVEGAKKNEYVLQMHRNIYGQKQSGKCGMIIWKTHWQTKLDSHNQR